MPPQRLAELPSLGEIAGFAPPALLEEMRLELLVADLRESILMDWAIAMEDKDFATIERALGADFVGGKLSSIKLEVLWTDPSGLEARGWKGSCSETTDASGMIEEFRRHLGSFSSVDRCLVKPTRVLDSATSPLGAGVDFEASWRIDGKSGDGANRTDLVQVKMRVNRDGDPSTRGVYPERQRRARSGWKISEFLPQTATVLQAASPVFLDRTEEVGLTLGAPSTRWAGHYGIAAGDFNRDGWEDLYVASEDGGLLFRNEQGKRFVDVSREAGVRDSGPTASGIFADLDGDGFPELVVGRPGQGATVVVYRNRGGARFEAELLDAPSAAALAVRSIVAADFDGNGRLDLYVCYDCEGLMTGIAPYAEGGKPRANALFWQEEDGSFREGAREAGVATRYCSVGALAADFTNDGRPDLFVANHFGAKNNLYINAGGRRFVDRAPEFGVGGLGAGMGGAIADLDQDGWIDLYVANMRSTATRALWAARAEGQEGLDFVLDENKLYRNEEGRRFVDVTEGKGVENASWAWSPEWFDWDNDGDLDLYVTNGYISGRSRQDL